MTLQNNVGGLLLKQTGFDASVLSWLEAINKVIIIIILTYTLIIITDTVLVQRGKGVCGSLQHQGFYTLGQEEVCTEPTYPSSQEMRMCVTGRSLFHCVTSVSLDTRLTGDFQLLRFCWRQSHYNRILFSLPPPQTTYHYYIY